MMRVRVKDPEKVYEFLKEGIPSILRQGNGYDEAESWKRNEEEYNLLEISEQECIME